MSRLAGARSALRLARRDAQRHPGTSLLVLVMIALPVAGVTAAAVLYATQDISGTEAIESRIGGAEASVTAYADSGSVAQHFDPADGWMGTGSEDAASPKDVPEIEAILGEDRPAIEVEQRPMRFETEKGYGDVDLTLVDLDDPLAEGLFRLVDGRMPKTADEVAVTAETVARGPHLGEDLVVRSADGDDVVTSLRVVGVVEHGRYRTLPRAVALPGAVPPRTEVYERTWLVGGGPVTWEQVRELNEGGAVVTSRAVLADPPPESALSAEVQMGQSIAEGPVVAVIALVVVMVLLEVVLLAGPAFAVGARRQARTLALLAAAGGTPRQARQVVLASGVVYGVVAALAGVLAGVVLGWALSPVAQRFVESWFGPFEVPWGQLAVVAAFGVVSALLAAVVPAWIASRQDVVAVLAGRRGDRKVSLRSPVLGVVVFGVGVGMAALGAQRVWQAEVLIAGSALVCVLGMLLCVPLVVVGLARVASRLPLPLRFAARDAARHRTRTVPAVAAVAATVAGVVALGTATASDEAQGRATYDPQVIEGAGRIVTWAVEADWDGLERLVADEAPDVRVTRIRGHQPDAEGSWTDLTLEVDGQQTWVDNNSSLGSGVLVGDRVPAVLPDLSAADRQRADRALAAGMPVVFADLPTGAEVTALLTTDWDAGTTEEPTPTRHEMDLTVIGYDGLSAPAQAILPPTVAKALAMPVGTVSLALTGGLDADTSADLAEALAVDGSVDFYVERGYQPSDEVLIIQLILGALGAVLVLGGTLTATFLALADARPDLATLAAVGGSPRTRRFVGASYALGVGLVGAILGAGVGLVPGIAITYPLTSMAWLPTSWDGPRHFLDIPWLLILAVVVGLPVLTAVVVGLCTRSRLPTVARID